MTGAGTGELIFGHETGFMGDLVDADADGTPDLFAFGRNPSLTELDLQNQLEDLRNADSAWAIESIKGNFDGAVGVEAVVSADVHNEVESIVFNDGGTAISPGLAASARIFTGIQYPSGTADRELLGCIPLEYSIDYEQGGMVTYNLSMAYADEQPGSSVDLSTATRVSDGSSLPWHGFELAVDGTSVEDLQSASLSISDIARLQYGGSPTPNRGVIASPSATLDVEAIFTAPSRLDLARGATNSAPPDTLDSVSGTITLTVDGTQLSTYNLASLKPDQYSWQNVLATDDTLDSTTFSVTGQDAVTVS